MLKTPKNSSMASKEDDVKWLQNIIKENDIDFYKDDIFNNEKYRDKIKKVVFRENRIYLFLILLIIYNVKIIYKDEQEFREKVIFAIKNVKLPIIGDKAIMDVIQEYCLYAIKLKNYIFLNAMETLLYHNRELILNVKKIKYKKYSILYTVVAYNVGKTSKGGTR